MIFLVKFLLTQTPYMSDSVVTKEFQLVKANNITDVVPKLIEYYDNISEYHGGTSYSTSLEEVIPTIT